MLLSIDGNSFEAGNRYLVSSILTYPTVKYIDNERAAVTTKQQRPLPASQVVTILGQRIGNGAWYLRGQCPS
jgi:hypothetical protein